MSELDIPTGAIAVIGMSGRFPGADTIEAFFQNLRGGVESIRQFTDAELEAAGIPASVRARPGFVNSGASIRGIDLFDAPFFGLTARDAAVTDPQQRVFIECAWEAIERAGYDPDRYPNRIGVFAGSAMSMYLQKNLLRGDSLMFFFSLDSLDLLVGNDRDFLSTRTSYVLGLRGPSVNVQTACSTSLVAVHLAVQSLLAGECEMALAGGVSIVAPQETGYFHQEGSAFAPDGRCRAFDADARGMVPGNGAGVVLLKPLEDAIRDRDSILAVIRGSAINNDGHLKSGYTAPSFEGHREVVREALAVAGVAPESISAVEAHGTGTPLGDPIEVHALSEALAGAHDCALGSVKPNIGHLNTAAGIAGFIKAVLQLEHRQLFPTLNFRAPNPELNLEQGPFHVNTQARDWPARATPRRIGVSALGIGGTNAHVILEEAPPLPAASSDPRGYHLLTLSAASEAALTAASERLVQHLGENPDINIADAAYTLQVGRRVLPHRRVVLARDREDAAQALASGNPDRVFSAEATSHLSLAFMFPGYGSQYVGMCEELYRSEPVFRDHLDSCVRILLPLLGQDLREVLFPQESQREAAVQRLRELTVGHAATFAVEYALARLWMAWGLIPDVMIGHSLGDYVAACIAGVFSLEDALTLVFRRAALVQPLPTGGMLAVALPPGELEPLLGDELSIAVINNPSQCIVSGTLAALNTLETTLEERGVWRKRLESSHAGHSRYVEPIVERYRAEVARVDRHPPRTPLISNLKGTWLTDAEATDPDYWARHLREPVRFADGIALLRSETSRILLEVGPGRALQGHAAIRRDDLKPALAVASMPRASDAGSEVEHILMTLGKLWINGLTVNWEAFHGDAGRRRLLLPTYPFERERYWVERPETSAAADPAAPIRLVVPAARERARSTSDAPPRTPIERVLHRIWGEVLGDTAIGIHDDFFELGGSSLMASQVLARVRNTFNVDLSLVRMLERPTIANAAEKVDMLLMEHVAALPDDEAQQLLARLQAEA